MLGLSLISTNLLIATSYDRRVAEMEQKLDDIFAMLSASNRATLSSDSSSAEVPYPTPSTTSDLNDSALFPQPHNAGINVFQPLTLTPSTSSWLKYNGSQDVIERGIITYEKAESLLLSYGTHAANFPFIVLSPDIPLDSLRYEKPFLLLAILTMTSTSNQQLQDQLEAELRESLGRKVIFNGEKSLDLLQGLLVYLAWLVIHSK